MINSDVKSSVTDYILEISFPEDLEEVVFGRLFLSRSSGNFSTGNTLAAYFETLADRDAAADALRELPVTLNLAERERVDWLQIYQQSLRPLLVGRSFLIVPDASLIPAGTSRHCLVIPQEQAFGTGSHESTFLCIELLEEIDLSKAHGLDIGSGSGILALAMLRLGAQKAMAFDVDPDTIRPLRDNRARNGMATARMPLFIGSMEAVRGRLFDVVTMNILPEVIVPLMPLVKRHVGGSLILSGILTDLRGEVLRACDGLQLVSERETGEWWAGRFTPIP